LGRHEPTGLERGLVQLQQALDEVAVVFQVAVELGLALSFGTLRTGFPRPQQTTILLSQLAQQKFRISLSDLAIVVTV